MKNMEIAVSSIFGGGIPKVSSRGDFYTDCPHCGGKKKLNINVNKGFFRCPRCDAKGGYLKLIALYKGYYPNNLSNYELKDIIENEDITFETVTHFEYKQVYKEEPIDFKKLDIANKLLFANLVLNKQDEEHLKSRGLVNLSRYKSFEANVVFPKALFNVNMFKDVPGFIINEQGNAQTISGYKGILFPYMNIHNQMVSFQIRTNLKEKGKKYVFLSSSSAGGPSTKASYCILGNPSETMYITEGALKADCARQLMHLLDMDVKSFVAIPGVNTTKIFINDLLTFKNKGVKNFIVAFDMDKKENIHVKRAEENLINALQEKGFNVKTLVWDDKYKGIDDFLYSKCKERGIL